MVEAVYHLPLSPPAFLCVSAARFSLSLWPLFLHIPAHSVLFLCRLSDLTSGYLYPFTSTWVMGLCSPHGSSSEACCLTARLCPCGCLVCALWFCYWLSWSGALETFLFFVVCRDLWVGEWMGWLRRGLGSGREFRGVLVSLGVPDPGKASWCLGWWGPSFGRAMLEPARGETIIRGDSVLWSSWMWECWSTNPRLSSCSFRLASSVYTSSETYLLLVTEVEPDWMERRINELRGRVPSRAVTRGSASLTACCVGVLRWWSWMRRDRSDLRSETYSYPRWCQLYVSAGKRSETLRALDV